MRAYLWAVGTIVATSLNQFGLAEDNPRQLYVAASEAIAQSDCPRAIESLEELLASYPDSQLANPAVLHLAECYLMVGQATDAFDLLDRHADTDATSREQDRHLELRIHAARSAAVQFETAGDFATAIKWASRCFRLQKSSQTVGNKHSDDVLRIFLKDYMNRIETGDPLETALENVDEALRLAAKFALAEHLYRQQEYELATSHFEQLKQALTSTRDEPPDWANSVDLRLAEIYLHSGRYEKAQQFIAELRGICQDPAQTSELVFLSARCAVACVEFDKAHKLLSSMIDAEPTTTVGDNRVQLARAHWMRGELFFLQQKYRRAIDDYRAAIEAGDALWTRRAYLQTAKCQELLGNTDEATAIYRQLTQDFPNSSEASFASQRIAKLLPIPDTVTR